MSKIDECKLQPLAVSVKEALRLSSLGRTKFYEELNRGAIRSHKAGKRRLVEFESLKNWLSSLPVQP